MMYSTAESTSSGPVGNPQGKKILLEYDINFFTYKNLEKEVPRQSWLYGYGEGAANIRKQTGINYFAESGMTLVTKDMKQVRAFTLQDRGWEGA